MTYVLFVKGAYFDNTRSAAEAFLWLSEWQALGSSAGLRFLRDDDEESLRWLIPPEVINQMGRRAA